MEGCLTCPAHVDPYLFILQQSAIALLAKVQLCERGNEGGEGGQMCQQQSDLYLDFALCLLSKAGPSEARERERGRGWWHQHPPELCPPPVNRDRGPDVPQGYAMAPPGHCGQGAIGMRTTEAPEAAASVAEHPSLYP